MLLKMRPNRVRRPFQGGLLLEQFQGAACPRDGDEPEEWVCSTVQAADGAGLSYTCDGRPLREAAGREVDILVKLLDSSTRLMLQAHPDAPRAQKYFHWPHGKTEAWHILGMRGPEAYVLLGFRPGITRTRWRQLFERQDVEGMTACLHRFTVQPGDTFFVPAGVPHAMGAGVFFAEVQEPTDITLRTERFSQAGARLPDEQLHGGAGFEAMFECFDYEGLTEAEALARFKVPAGRETLIGPQQTSGFAMQRLRLAGPTALTAAPYAVVVVLEGPRRGDEYYLEGRQAFSAGQELLVCTGPGGEVRREPA